MPILRCRAGLVLPHHERPPGRTPRTAQGSSPPAAATQAEAVKGLKRDDAEWPERLEVRRTEQPNARVQARVAELASRARRRLGTALRQLTPHRISYWYSTRT